MWNEENENSSFFFDDDFVRENLNFLFEDDLFESIEQGTSLHFRSYEEESSIYKNSKINTNLCTSWSSSSSGSISSVKEQASKYINVCLKCDINQPPPTCLPRTPKRSCSEADFGENNVHYDNSFLLDLPSDLTSTPTKNKSTLNVLFRGGLQELMRGDENPLLLESEHVDQQVDIEPDFDAQCKFCLKNGEPQHVYRSHVIKDAAGNVICPILSKHVCEVCGQTGVDAHTRKYCTLYNKNTSQAKPTSRMLSNGVKISGSNHK